MRATPDIIRRMFIRAQQRSLDELATVQDPRAAYLDLLRRVDRADDATRCDRHRRVGAREQTSAA